MLSIDNDKVARALRRRWFLFSFSDSQRETGDRKQSEPLHPGNLNAGVLARRNGAHTLTYSSSADLRRVIDNRNQFGQTDNDAKTYLLYHGRDRGDCQRRAR